MREVFDHIKNGFLRAKTEPLEGHPLAHYLRHDAPGVVEAALGALSENMLIVGSPGQGNWAAVPWISVFDTTVTTSATRGHYVVYLFSADMNRLHLSLNQGTTTVRNEFGARAVDELRRRAAILRARVPEFKASFSEAPIDLGATGNLPTGYEAGHAFGRSYDLHALPPDANMITDLSNLVELYLTVTPRGGTDASEHHTGAEEEAGLTDLFEQRKYSYHRRIERNSKASKEAKKALGYVCQACGFDFEKRYGPLGEKFIEAHHLTPLSELPEGKPVPQDPKKDFAVLCANCHRMIHRKDAPKDLAAFRELVQGMNP